MNSHLLSSLSSLSRRMVRILVDYDHRDLFCHPLDRVRIRQLAAPKGVRLEQVDKLNVKDGIGWLGTSKIRRFRRFLRRGDIGMYGYLGDELVSYLWCLARVPGRRLVGTHDPIETGEALLHRVYVRPQARRRGITLYAVLKMIELLACIFAGQGLKRVYTIVHVENEASQRAFLKAGFRHASRITMLVLLGHCFVYRFHDVQPDGSFGPGRLRVAFKLPEIIWDPAFDRFRDKVLQPVHPTPEMR